MANKEEYIIQTKNLAVGYKNKTLCKNININLKTGSIIALMGVNGSGKSTLMKTLIGLIPRLKGEIYILGKELSEYSRANLSHEVSVVLTDHISTSDMTVFETVSFGRYPHTSWLGKLSSSDIQIIEDSIREVGLEGFHERQLATLSDGELQRVMIARALAQQTQILILDEPASHLDIPNKSMIINLLKSLSENKGMTIIYSTHELEFIKKAADYVWIFDNNKSMISALPEDCYTQGHFRRVFGDSIQEF